jgi:hypothetical protein
MEKIRCPHCNAVNQDAEPTDACWQCGKPLNAAAAPTVVTPADTPTVTPAVEVQQQVTITAKGQAVPTLEERVAARKAARKGANRAVPAIVIAVILIILLIVFLALRH